MVRQRWVRLAVAGLFVVFVAWIATVKSNTRPVGYPNLADLVMVLSGAIEDGDEREVTRLCHQPLEVSFDRLAKQHAKLSYYTLLHEDWRWKQANSWTLGGHGAEYDHIHLDFLRQLDGKWYLKRIWGCR